jgi:hypothetical protein
VWEIAMLKCIYKAKIENQDVDAALDEFQNKSKAKELQDSSFH